MGIADFAKSREERIEQMILNYIGLVVGSIVGYIYLRKNKRNKRLRFVLRIVDFAILIAIGLLAVKEGRAYFFAEADATMEAAINDTFTDEEILAEIGLRKWKSESDQDEWVDEFREWTEKTLPRLSARARLPYADINELLQVDIDKAFRRLAGTTDGYLDQEDRWWEPNGATFCYTIAFRIYSSNHVEAHVQVSYPTRHDIPQPDLTDFF